MVVSYCVKDFKEAMKWPNWLARAGAQNSVIMILTAL